MLILCLASCSSPIHCDHLAIIMTLMSFSWGTVSARFSGPSPGSLRRFITDGGVRA
jgi:hypothetical protein